MAPGDLSADGGDVAYLLDIMSHMSEVRVEWKDVAKAHNVHPTTAPRRLKAIAKKHGYSYENGKVTKDGGTTIMTANTPKKTPAKRTATSKPTPARKKVRSSTAIMEQDGEVEEADDESMDDTPIKTTAKKAEKTSKEVDGGSFGEAVEDLA